MFEWSISLWDPVVYLTVFPSATPDDSHAAFSKVELAIAVSVCVDGTLASSSSIVWLKTWRVQAIRWTSLGIFDLGGISPFLIASLTSATNWSFFSHRNSRPFSSNPNPNVWSCFPLSYSGMSTSPEESVWRSGISLVVLPWTNLCSLWIILKTSGDRVMTFFLVAEVLLIYMRCSG